MTTRDDLVILYRTKILTDLLRDGAKDGTRLECNMDMHLYAFACALDDLRHKTSGDLMVRLQPKIVKRKP